MLQNNKQFQSTGFDDLAHYTRDLILWLILYETIRYQLPANMVAFLQFISSRGNEYFCEIDEDYLTDRFNLTGLNTEVQYYQYALDLVTDVFDMEVDDDMREQIEKSARHLYGLVHSRYIVTTRGLAKMVSTFNLERLHSSARSTNLDLLGREIQTRGVRQMSTRNLRVATPTTHGPTRHPQHKFRKTLLCQMRGYLQSEIKSPQ